MSTAFLLVLLSAVQQSDPPLLAGPAAVAIATELSGETAKRNLEFLARQHRMRGSRGYRAAAEFIAAQLRAYGLEEVTLHEIAADGRTFYGTQKARPAWDADFAELWELRESNGRWQPAVRLASWESMPVSLAQDSDSADVTADLVDVGSGTSASDYEGKDVQGRIVLASAQPEAVAPLAVDRFRAAGIISYAQNQRTAWYGEDENLVRWGHLDSFSPRRTFGFMISLKQARALRTRLAAHERIRLHARVHAARSPGSFDVLTAIIPGRESALRAEEIVYSCHLDHQRPGANDNASGCATILEVARTLSKLIREGKLSPPARTLRFVWPPEIEGTMALFHARPEMRNGFRAVVHMDMVGGGAETKSVFHVTRGPLSLPSFVYDVGGAIGEFVIAQTEAYAGGEDTAFPLVSPEGGKNALQARIAEFTMGSDHEVYTEGSFRIPAIYLNDWPDRYIHTNFDAAANIDATKLERAAFIGAASGWYLANLRSEDVASLWATMKPASLRRAATMMVRRQRFDPTDAAALTRVFFETEKSAFESIRSFARVPDSVERDARVFFQQLEALTGPVAAAPSATGDAALVFQRATDVTGPMSVFGYDWFEDHYQGPTPALLNYRGDRGTGSEYAYEVLSLVNGRRTAREIRSIVSAEYGPVPIGLVLQYLLALEQTGAIRR